MKRTSGGRSRPEQVNHPPIRQLVCRLVTWRFAESPKPSQRIQQPLSILRSMGGIQQPLSILLSILRTTTLPRHKTNPSYP